MKGRGKGALLALSAVVVAIVVGVCAGLFFGHNTELKQTVIKPISAEEQENNEAWKANYPAQFETFEQTKDNTDHPSHFESHPYMKLMYKGTGYAEEFNEPRGHAYMLDDIRHINENRWKPKQAACNTCKSSQIPGLIEKYGDKYYSMDFHKINDQLTNTVGCYNCHETDDPSELALRQPPFLEAMKARGIDVSQASRQEKRTLVCAQCHVTYYFQPETNKVTFPWKEGLTAEEQIKYYDSINFSEWVHPDSGTPLIKPRHMEYEYFKNSTHESAGVSCADCHMPYMKIGNQKISTHNVGSPLDTMEQSCLTCHRESKDWLLGRVKSIQDQTKSMEDRAGAAVTETIKTLAVAKDLPGVDKDKVTRAQRLHREGQYYMDCVMVTNGFGFHNPQQSYSDLARGIDLCQEATKLAQQAILEAGGTLPEISSDQPKADDTEKNKEDK